MTQGLGDVMTLCSLSGLDRAARNRGKRRARASPVYYTARLNAPHSFSPAIPRRRSPTPYPGKVSDLLLQRLAFGMVAVEQDTPCHCIRESRWFVGLACEVERDEDTFAAQSRADNTAPAILTR